MIQKAIFVLLLSQMINALCSCNQFKSQSTCYAYGDCLFVDGACSEQKCENIPYQEKCKSPKCWWDGEKCEQFIASQEKCQALEPQNCNNFYGCSYDYITYECGLITKCSDLKIEQCNGQTVNGTKCKVNPFKNECIEMIDCATLTGEVVCLSEYPNCSYENGKCQAIGCDDLKDILSCDLIDECQWRESKCQKKNCSLIQYGYQCNSNKCGWEDNRCFQCIEEGYAQLIGIAVFLFLI